jgi:hypothetical protein
MSFTSAHPTARQPDSSVSTANRQRAARRRVRNSDGRIFLTQKVQTSSGARPASHSTRTGDSLLGVKRPGRAVDLHLQLMLKIRWRYTSTSPYMFPWRWHGNVSYLFSLLNADNKHLHILPGSTIYNYIYLYSTYDM